MTERAPGETVAPLAETRLADLPRSEGPVHVVGRILEVTRREVTRRSDGRRRPILSGLLSDGTGTARFTWWDPPLEGVDRGDVIRAAPVQIREFRGSRELEISGRTRVELAGPADLPVAVADAGEPGAVARLVPAQEEVILRVRVAEVAPKTVTVRAERRQIFEGFVGDASGVVPFTAWTDFHLSVGESLEICRVRVDSFRGVPQLVLDERSGVERIPADRLPEASELLQPVFGTLGELEERGGAVRVEFSAAALAVLPPSGVVLRCTSCRRALTKGLCRVHAAVPGEPDLRARIVFDDGTGTATVRLDRRATELVSGRDLAGWLEALSDRPDPSILEEELFQRILGSTWRIVGRATTDDFGLTIQAESIEPAGTGDRPSNGASREKAQRSGTPPSIPTNGR